MKSVVALTVISLSISVFTQSTENPTSKFTYKRRNYITEERNKEIVLEFFQKCFGDKNFDAIDEYLGEKYIQHSHDLADGREGVREAVNMWLKDVPKRDRMDIKRVAADGDLVFVHLRMDTRQWGGTDEAIVDIFRVENGKIVEHWDVLQEVPTTPSKNNNTIF